MSSLDLIAYNITTIQLKNPYKFASSKMGYSLLLAGGSYNSTSASVIQ